MDGNATFAQALTLELEGKDRFDVREYALEEGLSAPFSIDLVAMCENPAVDFEQIVGKDATFTIVGRDVSGASVPHAWTGVVSEIHQLVAETAGLSTYHLTVVPKLWLLTQRTNCRVFQQMSDLDAVQAILAEWGIPATVKTTRAHKTRKYRVQYNETDHAFISRLLEAAGVTLLTPRGTDGGVVLDDAAEKGTRRALPLEHVNQPMDGTITATRFRASRALRSGKITFSDHDHRLPNTPLLAASTSSDLPLEQKLERFTYAPGSFRYGNKGPKDTPYADDRGRTRTDTDEAQRLADQAAHAALARSKRFLVDTNALDVTAGMVLKITSHPVAEREGELLATRVRVRGAFDEEPRLSVDLASASAPWRPEAVTPTPSVMGVECATVVGPAGETIHTDEFGRVRVQFHWDRYGNMDEQSSLWVHVNQAWAGGSIGSIHLPRIGQEVIVGFLGGDPEEPIIVGRTHTNLNRPPFPLPQNKTQSGFHSASVPETGGYNELMFEDKAGGELIRVHGEKDMATRINNDQSSSIGRDRSDSIERNDAEQVGGDQSHQVGGDMTSSVGQNQLMSVGSNMLSMVGADRLLQTVGASKSQAATHEITSQQGTTISVGQSMIYIGPDAIIIQSPKVLLNPGADVASGASLGGGVAGPNAK
ncbi:MAG TPA: type VI secretion system tip protein TssI/VgrG [Minicystis sp.]|nr:type VI secretion system tip protein TssI/VgrG [Minicystis sp.]